MFKHWSMRTKVTGGIAAFLLAVVLAGGAWGISTGKIKVRADSGAVTGKLSSSSGCRINGIPVKLETWINSHGETYSETQTDAYGNFSFSNAPYGIDLWVSASFDNNACNSGFGTCWFSVGESPYIRLSPENPVKQGVNLESYIKSFYTKIHVQNTSARPVQDARVLLYDGIWKIFYTNADGDAVGFVYNSSYPPLSTKTIPVRISRTGYETIETTTTLTGCDQNYRLYTLTGGTTPTPTPTRTPTPTPTPSSCRSNGQSCTTASQCCSNHCVSTPTGKKCQP